MTEAMINSEIKTTKEIMSKLMDCIKSGQKELYKEYLEISTYYLKLNQVKPNHNLIIA